MRTEEGVSSKRYCRPANHNWRRKSELDLTWRIKREILSTCFEVGYVSSSFLHGADPWYAAPPRYTIHGNTLSC